MTDVFKLPEVKYYAVENPVRMSMDEMAKKYDGVCVYYRDWEDDGEGNTISAVPFAVCEGGDKAPADWLWSFISDYRLGAADHTYYPPTIMGVY